jgi:hypothetical protein
MTARDRSAGRILVACLAVLAVGAPPVERAAAQQAAGRAAGQAERVAAATVLAIGRTPTEAEIERGVAQGPLSVRELIDRQRRRLLEDPEGQRAVALEAVHDAFGGTVPPGHTAAAETGRTYAELLQSHLAWLTGHPAEYHLVIERAYRAVLSRDPHAIEIEYWKRRPTLTFVLLAGCVENWAVRNQPGLMATTGVAAISVTSRFLATVRLSPPVAAEAREALGLPAAGGRTLATALGRHVVAPGAGDVVSVGGVHFVAAGGAGLGPS